MTDLMQNRPDTGTDSRGHSCNLHSWSGQGIWTPVCYTSDHHYASGMWDKPREIANGVYDSNGYEVAASTSADSISAEMAFSLWQGSEGHRAVILEQGVWAGKHWPALGVGVFGRYAVVWFGSVTDPQGDIAECP